jgi:hypothetical protein
MKFYFIHSPAESREKSIFAHSRPQSDGACEAFASLFSYDVFDYQQKNPLQYSLPGLFDLFLWPVILLRKSSHTFYFPKVRNIHFFGQV